MVTYRSLNKIFNYVTLCVDERRKGVVISIDGVNGSGKSYLSSFLSKKNGYSYIDIDGDYLIPNKGKYIDFIRYHELKAKITSLLTVNKIIVVDGICILKVLNRIGFNSDIKIYVKKLRLDLWRDGDLFDYHRNIADVLSEKRASLEDFENVSAYIEGRSPEINDSEEDMFHEIIRYHFEYEPDINADIVFERDVNT